MTTLLLLAFASILAGAIGLPPQSHQEPILSRNVHLLGSKECTWGPSYWCKNLTTAAGCHATKHCIQTVWAFQKLPPDDSSVCQTCLDMVKQARDQLLSNETQEEIKEVFEGSCKLLPVKIIASECCKLADEFIPELIDALASQMNPQVVCSVAGLCNSDRVQRMLEEEQMNERISASTSKANKLCEGCHIVMGIVENKFHDASRDQVLQSFMQVCGRMGSLSDACTNVVITYFNDIYQHLEDNLNAHDLCLVSGECSAMFHTHVNVEVTPLSDVGVIPIRDPDLPCDLCKQLVQHLQDILVANTTEEEFHKVLLGICKQTKSFKDQCADIVNEYYPMIYNFFVRELNGSVVCGMFGICPASEMFEELDTVPTMPLLSMETLSNPLITAKPIVPIGRVNVNKGGASVKSLETPEMMQLPIERLMPQSLTIVGNTELCEFCEYFLHFVQKALTDRSTTAEIERVIEKACDYLPATVNETCQAFVSQYGPAMVAILAQDIDPSFVCPKLSLCPGSDAQDVEVFIRQNKGEKRRCPLCLFALTSLEEYIKNDRTEVKIREGLDTLCSKLSQHLRDECNDFVETYTEEIVDACIAQLDPKEICVYLKFCEDNTPPSSVVPPFHFGGHIATNEIPDITMFGKVISEASSDSGPCVLCEFVISQLQSQLSNNATEEEIKRAVLSICSYLPKTVTSECKDFIKQYADAIIELLIQSLDPNEICKEIGLCPKKKAIQTPNNNYHHLEMLEPLNKDGLDSPQCSLCKIIMTQLETILQGKVNEADVIKAVHKVCSILPSHQNKECNEFIDKNGKRIIELLELAIQPSELCSLLMFCSSDLNMIRLDVRKCSVCEAAVEAMDNILANPNVDHALEHVLEKACRALPPKHQQLCRNIIDTYEDKFFEYLIKASDPVLVCQNIGLCVKRITRRSVGEDRCSWGPDYWCNSTENANECGAVDHCKTNVWDRPEPVLVGGDKCTWGPSYWCSNATTAEECGDGAVQHCKENVWDQPEPVLVGGDKCTWGPSYWCSNATTAEECGDGAVQHCQENVWRPSESVQKPGADKCSWGPAYWCTNAETAEQCGDGAVQHCKENVWDQPEPVLVGGDKCTWGPSYWCSNPTNAEKCGTVEHCEQNYWNKTEQPEIGNDECNQGLSYWCATADNANKCGAVEHCLTKVWHHPGHHLFGANKCTWGPFYWCNNTKNANECGKVEHCEANFWNNSERIVGAHKCTWGPSYWCSNIENANECGAVEHCKENVWNIVGHPVFGAEHCTWGPEYWCNNTENAHECGTIEYCNEKVWPSTEKLVGAHKCTWGPSYWCDSAETANECGALEHCQTNVWDQVDHPRLGEQPCTWGPSYWCNSTEKANECSALEHCIAKVWIQPEHPLYGADKCTYGPSYWCNNTQNAKECKATEHCETSLWNATEPLVGANPCTWGPSYWCSNNDNAHKCGAVEHCEKKLWGNPEHTRVGEEKCTWGPSYWCDSPQNAHECGVVEYCAPVWNKPGNKLYGVDKCSWGPSYWCNSTEKARECSMVKHCESEAWHTPKQILGGHPCTWGPSYWCENPENANKCNSRQHCEENVWSKAARPILGAKKCTWGPSYWCGSIENAMECGAIEHCQAKAWTNTEHPMYGAKKCTWGPAYWCKGPKNAIECGAVEHCETKVWNNTDRLVGAHHCTWGPSYWCSSEANANECGASEHCQSNLWNNIEHPGRGKETCTWGPSYWCMNMENAIKCGATEHCEAKHWTNSKPLVGANKCTWGPSYWCESEVNAIECGAVEHCEKRNNTLES